jgi:hypothetical protein
MSRNPPTARRESRSRRGRSLLYPPASTSAFAQRLRVRVDPRDFGWPVNPEPEVLRRAHKPWCPLYVNPLLQLPGGITPPFGAGLPIVKSGGCCCGSEESGSGESWPPGPNDDVVLDTNCGYFMPRYLNMTVEGFPARPTSGAYVAMLENTVYHLAWPPDVNPSALTAAVGAWYLYPVDNYPEYSQNVDGDPWVRRYIAVDGPHYSGNGIDTCCCTMNVVAIGYNYNDPYYPSGPWNYGLFGDNCGIAWDCDGGLHGGIAGPWHVHGNTATSTSGVSHVDQGCDDRLFYWYKSAYPPCDESGSTGPDFQTHGPEKVTISVA